MSEPTAMKASPCQNGVCFREAQSGSVFCAKHADADPNQFPWFGCVGILVVLMGIGWLIFSVWNGNDDAPSTATYQAPAGSGTGPSDTSLASDASMYLRSNFPGDAAFILVNSVEVKSGVLWIKTAIPAGDVASAVAVCGLGSSWAYGDPAAVTAGIWGVSVRASDGQRLIQRDGIDDTCS